MAYSGIVLGYQTSSQGVNLGMINLKPAIEAIEVKEVAKVRQAR
jgi:hypothetical protein